YSSWLMPEAARAVVVVSLRPLSVGIASAAGATASPRARNKVVRALRVTVGSFRPDRLQVRSTANETRGHLQRGIEPVSDRHRAEPARGPRSRKRMLGTTPRGRPPSISA